MRGIHRRALNRVRDRCRQVLNAIRAALNDTVVPTSDTPRIAISVDYRSLGGWWGTANRL